MSDGDGFGSLVVIFIFLVLIVNPFTVDYSNTNATVKVLEVGERYVYWFFGKQYYIRIQNSYSDQYASSSESWETCIDQKDYQAFLKIKEENKPINIHVVGNGFSTKFKCRTGDFVASYGEGVPK